MEAPNQRHLIKAASIAVRQLSLPGADVVLVPSARPAHELDALFEELRDETPWRAESIRLFGKTVLQPRLLAWHGDADAGYTYSRLRLIPAPWTPRLLELRTEAEHIAGHPFNSVLLNFYRNGRDSMGMHADDEPELGTRPTIASLSLGATREITFRSRTDRTLPSVRVPLIAGDWLIMRGDTQTNWHHGIAKTKRPLGGRINLTFRQVGSRMS